MNRDRSSRPLRLLRIDSSGRTEGSISRQLGDLLVDRLTELHGPLQIASRDTAAGLPFVDAAWIGANFTEPDERSPEQHAVLALSDELVEELANADLVVIGVPIYNFGIPAALKAWVDLVARARKTFRYTENGPVGLLTGKKAYLAVASGGVAAGSEVDFATTYLRHVLAFLGIEDVEIVAADRLMARGDEALAQARTQIVELAMSSSGNPDSSPRHALEASA